jgi:hypothetical protein
VLGDLRVAQIIQPRLVVGLGSDPLAIVSDVIVGGGAGGGWSVAMLGPGVGAGWRSRRGMIGAGATSGPTPAGPVALDGVLAMGFLVPGAAV